MNKIFIKANIQKSGDKSYKFLASTSAIDRQGDSIDQSGWELKNYLDNPVILWAHRYDELPLGKAISVQVTERGLEIDIEFADEEANPKAVQVKNLIDSGILNAGSVGFISKQRDGNIITVAELLEFSIVPVPANQEALTLAYKSMDLSLIQKDIEEVLEHDTITEEVTDTPVIPEEVPGIPAEVLAEAKSGRVLSKKNKELISDVVMSMKTTVSALEKLLEVGDSVTENAVDSEGPIVVIERKTLVWVQSLARVNDQTNERLLSALKQVIKS